MSVFTIEDHAHFNLAWRYGIVKPLGDIEISSAVCGRIDMDGSKHYQGNIGETAVKFIAYATAPVIQTFIPMENEIIKDGERITDMFEVEFKANTISAIKVVESGRQFRLGRLTRGRARTIIASAKKAQADEVFAEAKVEVFAEANEAMAVAKVSYEAQANEAIGEVEAKAAIDVAEALNWSEGQARDLAESKLLIEELVELQQESDGFFIITPS